MNRRIGMNTPEDNAHTRGYREASDWLGPLLDKEREKNAQLRTHLIQWENGYVRCLVCGHRGHGGHNIPHDDGCLMEGFTKQSYNGPAVCLGTDKGNCSYCAGKGTYQLSVAEPNKNCHHCRGTGTLTEKDTALNPETEPKP